MVSYVNALYLVAGVFLCFFFRLRLLFVGRWAIDSMRMKCFGYVDGNASSIIWYVCRKENQSILSTRKLKTWNGSTKEKPKNTKIQGNTSTKHTTKTTNTQPKKNESAENPVVRFRNFSMEQRRRIFVSLSVNVRGKKTYSNPSKTAHTLFFLLHYFAGFFMCILFLKYFGIFSDICSIKWWSTWWVSAWSHYH